MNLGQKTGLWNPGQRPLQDINLMPALKGMGQYEQAGTNSIGQGNDVNAQQGQLAQMLFQQANGGGPNPAQTMLNQATQSNIGNAYAMAQANPGNAAAARNISNQVGDINQQAAQQGSLLRQQQQLNAQGELGGLLQGQRGQDIQQQGVGLQATGLENAPMLGMLGGGLQGLGSLLGLGAQGHAMGGEIPPPTMALPSTFAMGGGSVPGQASTAGDSSSNDSVRAALSPGEIVLPRSVAMDPDAPEKAKLFVEAIRKQKKAA